MEAKICISVKTILELRQFAYLNSGGDLDAAEKIYQFLIGGCKDARLLTEEETSRYYNGVCAVNVRADDEISEPKETINSK